MFIMAKSSRNLEFMLALRVPSFFVEKRFIDRLRLITLGRFVELTVENACKQAQGILGQIAAGVDSLVKKY
jgi:hypothetical protein